MVSLQRAYSLHLIYRGCMRRLVIVTFSVKPRGSAPDVSTTRQSIRLCLLLLGGIEVFVKYTTSSNFSIFDLAPVSRFSSIPNKSPLKMDQDLSLQAHTDHITSLPLLEASPALLDLTAKLTTSVSPKGQRLILHPGYTGPVDLNPLAKS